MLAIKRIQRLYKKKEKEFRYLYVVGRGGEEDNLHMHMPANTEDDIAWEEICKVACRKDKVIAHVTQLSTFGRGESDAEIMQSAAKYLYDHYRSLTDTDKQTYKKKWYSSTKLFKFDYNPDVTRESGDTRIKTNANTFLAAVKKAYIYGNIDTVINRYMPNYKLLDYGYWDWDNKRTIPIIFDDFGRCYLKLILVRKGSLMDNTKEHHKIVYTDGLVIDKVTGEVINDRRVRSASI